MGVEGEGVVAFARTESEAWRRETTIRPDDQSAESVVRLQKKPHSRWSRNDVPDGEVRSGKRKQVLLEESKGRWGGRVDLLG